MTNVLTRFTMAGVIASSLFTFACSSPQASAKAASVKPEKDRHIAPDFALKDANGATVRLSDYKGKVVLLDFWATWCGPCKIEIPWFMEFEQQYKDQGFAVLGVSMDEEGWNAVTPFVQQRKMNYRIMTGTDQVAELYGGLDSLPTTLLIDRSGRIAKTHIGLEVGKDGFQDEITDLLASPRAAMLPRSSMLPALVTSAR